MNAVNDQRLVNVTDTCKDRKVTIKCPLVTAIASGKINEIPQFRWWGKKMNDKRLKRNRAKIKKSQCLLGLYRIKQKLCFI